MHILLSLFDFIKLLNHSKTIDEDVSRAIMTDSFLLVS